MGFWQWFKTSQSRSSQLRSAAARERARLPPSERDWARGFQDGIAEATAEAAGRPPPRREIGSLVNETSQYQEGYRLGKKYGGRVMSSSR
jgi:hypothetical protein